MASFLDKVKVNTAVTDHTKLDLTSDHISTANFMQFNVAWSKEMVPGERVSVNMQTFTRLQPMPVPTFGRARINNRAFFVPFRTIFPGWNDFITDSVHSNAAGASNQITYVPRISQGVFHQVFFSATSPWSEIVGTVGDEDLPLYDYADLDGVAIKLTYRGRQAMKILNSLGYQIPFTEIGDTSTYYSALPLMAICKVYYDWYYPSAYADDNEAAKIAGYFNKDNVNNWTLTVTDVDTLLNFLLYVSYDSDYFVSAWQNPMNPNDGSFSPMSITDPTNGTRVEVSTNSSDGAQMKPAEGQSGVLTGLTTMSQFGLDALRSLTDYMKRHQLVGARALDRYLSRFGVQLSAEKLKRSVYIGSGSDDIQFGDVTATADTTGAQLGDYAGKGIGYGKSNFDYETDEYGIFVIVSTILPKAGYYQGFDRNVLHTSRFDYWTPEMDNLGTQAIAKGELFVPTDTNEWSRTQTDMLGNGVFGWTPRYAEYKVAKDRLTGDFRYNSMNVGQESWHTFRELDYTQPEAIIVNKTFVQGGDAEQYSRIFYNTDGYVADKFNVIYHFDVASESPMKALWDTYDFEEKGKSVVLNANGVKMN